MVNALDDAGQVDLAQVTAIVNRLRGAQERYAAAEKVLAAAKAEMQQIECVDLPEALTGSGLAELTTADGIKVSIKEGITAAISAENKEIAHRWLRESGFADLIKNKVEVDLGRGQDNVAGSVRSWCEENGITYKATESVHPQTLQAWVREQLSNGKSLPQDLFGVFHWRKAIIKEK
jgi:hypothetical protein